MLLFLLDCLKNLVLLILSFMGAIALISLLIFFTAFAYYWVGGVYKRLRGN